MDRIVLTDEDLSAFIDGELDEARDTAVAAAVAASPELSERVERMILDKEMIARVYGPLIEQPVPERLRRMVTGHPPAPARFRSPRRLLPAAVALAAAIVAAVIVYPRISGVEGDPLVAEALAVRSGEVHAERQFADTDISAEAVRDRLVQAALAVPVKVPNLEKAGFHLVAISTYPDKPGRQALQLSYRDRKGTLFTMYMRPTAGGDRFELSSRRNMQVCVWQNDDLSVVMLGEMPAHEMLKVATATYADLNF